ncbi:hypothetical protein D9M68_587470 [compost metagenome]
MPLCYRKSRWQGHYRKVYLVQAGGVSAFGTEKMQVIIMMYTGGARLIAKQVFGYLLLLYAMDHSFLFKSFQGAVQGYAVCLVKVHFNISKRYRGLLFQ